MNFKRWKKIKIKYKIAIPFILINLITASVAGPIAYTWVAQKIRKETETSLRANLSEVKQYFEKEEKFLKVVARSLSSFPSVEKAALEKSEEDLRLVLIPQKIVAELDFVEVVDEKGIVIFNQKGPFKKGININYLETVRQSLIDITASQFVKEKGKVYLVACAPIHKPQGITGALIVGKSITPSSLHKLSKKKYHAVIFKDGKVLVQCAECISPLKMGEYREALYKESSPSLYYFEKKPYLYINSPLHLNHKPEAVIQIFHPAQSMFEAMRTVTINVIALNALLLLIMAFMGYGIARLITDPLHQLVETSKKISAGDLESEANIDTGDELDELATSFNEMVGKLKKRTEELEKKVFELSVLQEVSINISSTLDLNKILPVIGESNMKLFDADIVCVMLYDPQTKELKEGICLKSPRISTELAQLAEEKSAKLLKKGKPQLLSQSDDFPFLNSLMTSPLVSEEKTLGLVLVGSIDKTFTQDELDILFILAQQAASAVSNATLLRSLEQTYLGIVRALAIALDARDPYTRGHSEQVARYSLMLANELGLSEREKRDLELAAYLHDLGKIGIRDEILLKPAKLTSEEMKVIREHPSIGASILSPLTFLGDIVPTVRYHHEHYDGGGYPEGIKDERIPLGARILALADAFDAITSDRPYRGRRNIKEAVEEIKRCSGTQFDPKLVETFIKALKKHGLYEED
jgi:putative nucleotidyltransferase with HDIG domain